VDRCDLCMHCAHIDKQQINISIGLVFRSIEILSSMSVFILPNFIQREKATPQVLRSRIIVIWPMGKSKMRGGGLYEVFLSHKESFKLVQIADISLPIAIHLRPLQNHHAYLPCSSPSTLTFFSCIPVMLLTGTDMR
jgi:hypothetical protein